MSGWHWAIIGAVAAGPIWIVVALLLCRRMWRSARRLAKRTQSHEHLVEVGRLVGGLAHEIKNPLSTMNLNLKLLLEDAERMEGEGNGSWTRRLRNVQQEADRLRAILDDFLRFAGKLELHREPTDMSALLEEVIDFFSPQAEASRVVMRASLPEEPVRCNVDPKLIKQALLNLMLNAVDAMSDGGELLVRLTIDRSQAHVEVIDTGPGIPPELQKKIFQIYVSTKKGGSGIGLSMTRRLIREHGGSVHLDSEPGKGTRFVVSLPRMTES